MEYPYDDDDTQPINVIDECQRTQDALALYKINQVLKGETK